MSASSGSEQAQQQFGALDGVRVLDFTRVVSGPYATMILADHGANVIKVEAPGDGDETRMFPPHVAGESTYYMSLNRNKRGVVLDLRCPEGRAKALELARTADVVVHNFRPGAAEKFGMGYEELRLENPALIYCSISAYGPTGPYADQPGYDLFVSGLGGLMSVTGEPGATPQRAGINFVDYMAGLNAAIGILLAIQARSQTGVGQQVAVSLLDSLLSTAGHIVTGYSATGLLPQRTFDNQHPNIVPYGTFQTSDGYVNVGVIASKSWMPFCDALGATELAAEEQYRTNAARVARRDALLPIIQRYFLQRSSADWLARFNAHDVPSGPIKTYDEVIRDPQVAANESLVALKRSSGSEVLLAKTPVRLSSTPAVSFRQSPGKGEHQSALEEVSPWDSKP